MSTPPDQVDRPLDPEKLLRLASVVRAVLDEAKGLDPNETPAQQLAELHARITNELQEALTKSLVEELQALDLQAALRDGATSPEIKIAYSGLIGWLQGLFQGLSAAMQIQSMQQAGQIPAGDPAKSKAEEDDVKGRYL